MKVNFLPGTSHDDTTEKPDSERTIIQIPENLLPMFLPKNNPVKLGKADKFYETFLQIICFIFYSNDIWSKWSDRCYHFQVWLYKSGISCVAPVCHILSYTMYT